MALVDGAILNRPASATPMQMLTYLRKRNPTLPAAEAWEIVNAYRDLGALWGIDPAAAFAQAMLESNSFRFGGQVHPNQHNPAGIAATNDGKVGSAYATWEAGIAAQFVHILAWCGDERGTHDPRRALVDLAAKDKGYARTWRELGGRWAVPTDRPWNEEGGVYGTGIESYWQGIRKEQPVTVAKPPVISQPSPNFGGYQHPHEARCICWHITQGTNSLGWLRSPASQASANYLIARNGVIYELVPPTESAWANGKVNRPDRTNPVIDRALTEGRNLNTVSISVEHEGFTSRNMGGSLTPAQVDATVNLAAWLCQRFGIAPDQSHILGHYEVDSVDRPYCPGFSSVEWQTWVGRVAALVAGDSAPVGPPAAPGATDPGFPGALAPDGRTVLNGLDFGGVSECVEEVTVRTRNDQGKRYERTWVAHHLEPWEVRQ